MHVFWSWALMGLFSSLIANPLKSGCFKQGWIKVVSVDQPLHIEDSGLCEHPSGRVFCLKKEDDLTADALWCDPIDHSYYLRDGNRRIVLSPIARSSMVGFLQPDGSLSASYWNNSTISDLGPITWQDWEVPIAMSADSRIVIGESERVFWVPEFNGISATPITWTNIGWTTLRVCHWAKDIDRQLLNISPFSPAHRVLTESVMKEGIFYLPSENRESLIAQGYLVCAPLIAPRTTLQKCTSTANPTTCQIEANY